MKIFAKIKKFYNDHRYEINTVLTCTAVIGAGLYIGKKVNDYIFSNDDNANVVALPSALTPEENDNYEWSEEKYRETYDRVVEFAKTLQLADGESYWLDRDDRYNNGEVIVSHMIDGIGVYPNEEETDEDTV